MALARGGEKEGGQRVIEECIEQGLLQVLGESGLQMVLRFCPMATAAVNPARLDQELKKVFMDEGAAVIMREIATRLLEKVSQDDAEKHSAHFPTFGYNKGSWFPTRGYGSANSARLSKSQRKTIDAFVALASQPRVVEATAAAKETDLLLPVTA